MPKRVSRRGRVTGIGGVFFKSRNPERLLRWYETHLDLERADFPGVVFPWIETGRARNQAMTVWAIFPHRTRYFSPSRSRFMINYRVDDLDALLRKLRRQRVWVDPHRDQSKFGRFAWVRDSDGNRVELWEPPSPRRLRPVRSRHRTPTAARRSPS